MHGLDYLGTDVVSPLLGDSRSSEEESSCVTTAERLSGPPLCDSGMCMWCACELATGCGADHSVATSHSSVR